MKRVEKELLDEAFRRRQGQQGALQSCLCAYPLRRYATQTLHDERCPAHVILRLRAMAEEIKRVDVPLFDGVMCRVCGCIEDDCSNCMRRTGVACSWIESDLCSACGPHRTLITELRNQRDEARMLARILAHSFEHDSRPPRDVVTNSLKFPAMPEEL